MHQRCCHVHSIELLTPCHMGFDYRACQCYIRNNEVLYTEITGNWPLCCVPCHEMKQERLKLIMQEKLIRLKAATMAQRLSVAELDQRFSKWKLQCSKLSCRMGQWYGYQIYYDTAPSNLDEDETDPGWQFPLGKQAIRTQMRDLNRRDGLYPELGFWRDRPNWASRYDEGKPVKVLIGETTCQQVWMGIWHSVVQATLRIEYFRFIHSSGVAVPALSVRGCEELFSSSLSIPRSSFICHTDSPIR